MGMGKGFPLPDSDWYFDMDVTDGVWTFQANHYKEGIAIIGSGSSKRIALERFWDAFQEYCFHDYPRGLHKTKEKYQTEAMK